MVDFVRWAAGAIAILILPGYALLMLARDAHQWDLGEWDLGEWDWLERFCLALGLSLAAVPLFLYATTLIGVRQGPAVVWGLLILCALVVAWGWLAGRPTRMAENAAREPSSEQRQKQWIYAALVVVFAFALWGRLWSVRDIAFPAWTDSYGHAVITQMVLDQGMVPTTYEPYAAIPDFTYHFGFHALAAWFHWLTGLPMLHGMVILGQLLNALVVPTTYIFAAYLFRSRVAGLAAAVVAALISHMPAQFVNWGRFTQIDGQMLLPVAVVLFFALLQAPRPRPRLILINVVAFAGLFVAHYRVFIFGVLLAIVLWGMAMIAPPRGQSRGRLLRESALLTLLGLLVLAPWLWRLAQGFGSSFATTMVSGYEAQQYGSYYHFDPKELLDFGMAGYLWAVAGVGALWGLWRRNRMVMALLLWIAAMFAGANLHYLNFTPLYSDTIVIIALYLPLAALIGYLVHEVVNAAATRWGVAVQTQRGVVLTFATLSLAGLVALGVYSVGRDVALVERENIFVRAGDLQAMNWIEREIPADALFYIATSFWTPGVAHGLDGGYFLPLLAARQTIMPPQHYASDGSGDYRAQVNQRLVDLGAAQDVDALWEVLKDYGVTHVYIGVRKTGLDPAFFAARPDLFTPLYHQDDVWIFAVNPLDG